MNLRKKLLMMLVGFTVVGVSGMLIFTNVTLKTGFEEIEVEILEGTVLWGVDDIIDLALMVDSATAPIAAWDSLYDYIETQDTEFIDELFSDNVLQRNEFNLVVIYSIEGEIIYEKYYDYINQVERNLPQIFNDDSTYSVLSNYGSETSIIGILNNEDQMLIVASRPILNTAETLPSRGCLVLGYLFTENDVESLQELSGLPLEYSPINSVDIPESIRSELTLDNPFTYQIDRDLIHGYYLVENLFNEPGVIVSITQTREVYQASQEVRREFIAVIFGIGLLLGSISVIYANRYIVNSLTRLADEISEINEIDDLSARVHVTKGDDEINQLTRMVNTMLERLEESRKTEKRQQEAMNKLREEGTREIFEAAKKISYLVQNELERPLRSMKQVAYSLREEGKKDLAEMLESSIKYNEATLLELSSLTNLGEPKRTVSDMSEVVDAAINNIEPKVGVTIKADTGEEFLAINIDALKITRAIENVIRNSVESIVNHGEVHIVVTSDEEKATVTISDNGVGINPDDLEFIFEPFFTTKPNAMGLGLPYAKQVIEAHGGSITINTNPGEGTTVVIVIPLKQGSE